MIVAGREISALLTQGIEFVRKGQVATAFFGGRLFGTLLRRCSCFSFSTCICHGMKNLRGSSVVLITAMGWARLVVKRRNRRWEGRSSSSQDGIMRTNTVRSLGFASQNKILVTSKKFTHTWVVLGGYRFNVYFDRKEIDEKRKYKKENAEVKNQFEK